MLRLKTVIFSESFLSVSLENFKDKRGSLVMLRKTR